MKSRVRLLAIIGSQRSNGNSNYLAKTVLDSLPVVRARATGPKVHHITCAYYRKWLENPTTTTKWHGPYETEEEAWEVCKALSSKSKFEPSYHQCVRQSI